MTNTAPVRLFLDTNVYLIGVAYPESPEAKILEWAGFNQDEPGPVEIIVFDELLNQILRVSKRLRGKDWGSELVARIWQKLVLRYVLLEAGEISEIASTGLIPREDAGMYLTARRGDAECFISSNHELIRNLDDRTGEFECLTPSDFVSKYL